MTYVYALEQDQNMHCMIFLNEISRKYSFSIRLLTVDIEHKSMLILELTKPFPTRVQPNVNIDVIFLTWNEVVD